jgi:hypothetical protein
MIIQVDVQVDASYLRGTDTYRFAISFFLKRYRYLCLELISLEMNFFLFVKVFSINTALFKNYPYLCGNLYSNLVT